jgi:hypothetical protein
MAAPALTDDPEGGIDGTAATGAAASGRKLPGRRCAPELAAAAAGDAGAAAGTLLGLLAVRTVLMRGLKPATPTGAGADAPGDPEARRMVSTLCYMHPPQL